MEKAEDDHGRGAVRGKRGRKDSLKSIRHQATELYRKTREQVNYLLFGGLTTLVSLGSYWLCTRTFLNPENPLQLQAANVISWVCAVTFAYVTNRRYVFFSREKNLLREAGKFFLSRLVTLGMEMGVMALGVSVLGMDDRVVKLAATVLVMIMNYVLSRLLVFRRAGENQADNSPEKEGEGKKSR